MTTTKYRDVERFLRNVKLNMGVTVEPVGYGWLSGTLIGLSVDDDKYVTLYFLDRRVVTTTKDELNVIDYVDRVPVATRNYYA